MAEDQYDLDHAIEKLVRESEYCFICRCKGNCEGGCIWVETNICSNCFGSECNVCGRRRARSGEEVCQWCLNSANELARERKDWQREHAENERLIRWLDGKEPGRAPSAHARSQLDPRKIN